MSKNFELLQKFEEESRGRTVSASAASPSFSLPRSISNEPITAAGSTLPLLGEERRAELLKLATRLRMATSDERCTIALAGVEESDGPVQLAAWTGELMAQSTQKEICIVDARFGAPALHRLFGVSQRGFSDALCEGGPIRNYTQRIGTRLWLLCAGTGPGDAAYGLEDFRARIGELRQEFDCVLLALSNLEHDPQATLLAELSDAVVLVLEANSSRRDNVENATRALSAAGVSLLGAVLNNRDFPVPKAIYDRL